MTEKTNSAVAFEEAWNNNQTAEKFADAGNVEKAYLAAYIASVWTGIGNALYIVESETRIDSRLPLLPSADENPNRYRTVKMRCDNGCGTIYADITKKSTCWKRCTKDQHVHTPACWHVWRVVDPQHTHSPDLCEHRRDPFRDDCPDCNTPRELFSESPVCPARCSVAP